MSNPRQISEIKVFSTNDPAAGGTPDPITVGSGERWRLQSLLVSLNSDVTAGNRIVFISIDQGNGTNSIQMIGSGYLQPASKNVIYNWGCGVNNSSAVGTSNTLVAASLPVDFALESGWRILIIAEDLEINDNFSKVTVSYELLNTGV